MIRQIPGQVATVIIGLILFVFVAYPLGSVLVESFAVSGPMTVFELREMTLDALDLMEPKTREKTVSRWIERAKPRDRMDATAAALELIGEGVPWDREAAFDKQIEAARKTVAGLDAGKRAEFEAQFPIAYVMLKKRIPLAFKVKTKLSEEQFENLRTGAHEGIGLEHYLAIFKEARLQKGLRNSLFIAIISCTITTLLAYAIAYGVNRRVLPAPNLVRYGVLTPLVSPPVMIATAAILMFGRQGALTKGLLDRTLGWINADVDNLYGLSGVIVAEVFSFLPAAFIIMDNVLSKHDGRVEEAAASQGASPWQVFTRVTLPLSMPGLRRTVILVFILAMTDFGNPLVIGKDIPVLAGILYDEMIGFQNTKLSAALAMWMVVPALSAFFLLESIGRKKRYDTGDSGAGPPELPVPFTARVVITVLTGAVLGLVVILYGTIIVASFVKIWGVDYSFTPHHYTSVDAVPGFVSEYEGVTIVWDSFKVSVIAAPIGGVLALVVAYIVERVRPVGGNLMSFVTLLPAILPHILFGIGYIIAFNLPFGQKGLALTGTMSILVLNLMFGHIYVGVLAGRAVLQRMDASVDEAAEILGASLVQRFTRVTLPMMRHAALLGTLYVFVQAMTSLSSIVFLVSPGNDLAAVAILDAAVGSYYGAASAMSVTMLLIVFAVMGGMWWFERFGPAWARLSAHEAGRA
ncbi:MAG: iron ABC transporter permease [Alphaproteobacteria bacterium]|nr:MAG: iron ABC transporter permease [Alphaproteobacteria bacterium]